MKKSVLLVLGNVSRFATDRTGEQKLRSVRDQGNEEKRKIGLGPVDRPGRRVAASGAVHLSGIAQMFNLTVAKIKYDKHRDSLRDGGKDCQRVGDA